MRNIFPEKSYIKCGRETIPRPSSKKSKLSTSLDQYFYQFLIKKCEDVGIKYLNDPKAFIEHSNTINDIYNNIDDYNATRKRNILIVFDDIIAGIMANKKNVKT